MSQALEIRRPKFDFSDSVPFLWNPDNPAFSLHINVVSMFAICFEQMIVAAVQEAKPFIKDQTVADEATAFLRQEAQHSNAHRKHVNALIKAYPGLQETFDAALASYDELTANTPLDFRLAYIADLEATFTPSFKLVLDNEQTLFRPGDDRVASLLLWHFVEEVEHRSSALVIYDEVVGRPWYRLRALPQVVKHLAHTVMIIAEGVDAHVPMAERGLDARALNPRYAFTQSLRSRLWPGRYPAPRRVPAPMANVPIKQKLVAGARFLMSQTPMHNPAHQPLPAFADQWFDRWNHGGDVVRWYTAKAN